MLKKGMVGLCLQTEDRIGNNSKGSRYDVVRAGHRCMTATVTQGPTLRGLALGLTCCHHMEFFKSFALGIANFVACP